MGGLINSIIAILIVAIITAVSSTFFYKKGMQAGQESGWQLSKQLIPLKKGELYLSVEQTDANGLSFLSVQEISQAIKDKNINQRELRFRLNLALNGMNLQEYNDKYRGGKKGL